MASGQATIFIIKNKPSLSPLTCKRLQHCSTSNVPETRASVSGYTHVQDCMPGQPGPDHEARSLSVRTDKCPGHRHGLFLSKCTCSCHSSTLLRVGIGWHGVTIPRVKEYGHKVHLGLHVPQDRQEAKVQTEWEHSHRGVGAKPSSHLTIPAPCNALDSILADEDCQGALCVLSMRLLVRKSKSPRPPSLWPLPL